MIRLVIGAAAAAAVAAFILIQMEGATELALWEALLVLLVGLQYRGIPSRGDPLESPLFKVPGPDLSRLPRAIATSELMVVDATSGYLSPDRRLRPGLKRIAEHRLDRHGVRIDSIQAVELLGEREWNTLMGTGDDAVPVEDLELLVAGLEKL
jgi:hypothetical protein